VSEVLGTAQPWTFFYWKLETCLQKSKNEGKLFSDNHAQQDLRALWSCAFGRVNSPVDTSLPSKSCINPSNNTSNFSDHNEAESHV